MPRHGLLLALVTVALIATDVVADDFGSLHGVAVVRVYDGDTFFVDIPGLHPIIGDEIGIRVRGVDTPEIRGDCDRERALARAARDFAAALLEDSDTVDLVSIERGKYFRIVATVLVDGRDLAGALVAAGLGVPYGGDGPSVDWCE